MRMLISFVFAVGAGLVGAVGWAVAASAADRELIGVGLVVAVLTGIGARLGARERTGVLTGVIAAVAAFFTLGVGLAASSTSDRLDRLQQVNANFQSALPPYSQDVLMSYIAQGVADEWEGQGRTLDWPQRSTSELLRYQRNQFPAEAWDEAVLRYESLDQAGQREVNKLWALEHDKRRAAHRQRWQDIKDDSVKRSSPQVRQAVAIGSLVLAGIVGGVPSGASASVARTKKGRA